jgi:hypothetical protein
LKLVGVLVQDFIERAIEEPPAVAQRGNEDPRDIVKVTVI